MRHPDFQVAGLLCALRCGRFVIQISVVSLRTAGTPSLTFSALAGISC
jgi:hypothetical protein